MKYSKPALTAACLLFSLGLVQCSKPSESARTSENEGQSPGAEISDVTVVESGTYTGTAYKVDPEEKEIYVKRDDGSVLELYLKEGTELTRNGENVEFGALQEGQKLEVEVEKSGEHLNPLAVRIVE